MSTHQDHVLEIARRAWQHTRPGEDEVDAAVRRVARRLRARDGVRRSRMPSLIVAFGLVLLAALAYAAVQRSGKGTATERPPPPPAAVAAQPATPPLAEQESEPSTAEPSLAEPTSETPRGEPSAAESGRGPAARRRTAEAPARAPQAAAGIREPEPESASTTWREVDEALGARDDTRAARALGELAASEDPQTRLKAQLGLAQLAASRGDCGTARRIASGIIAHPGVDPALARRAQRVAARCQ
jgi:hypothetical protein